MKTGRLLKFQRPSGEVHAYLFSDGGTYKAVLYLFSGPAAGEEPLHTVEGPSEAAVERGVRDWIERHFPRAT
jgi:hypothetical protein